MASVFSMIIAGDIPGHFVWRDDQVVAIMTIQPFREGHAMVIPREEIDHWDDMPPALAAHTMQVSQKIARGIKRAFPCKRVGMLIAGLEVPHTHLHVLPIDTISELSFANARDATPEALAVAAEKLRKALQDLGYSEASE